MQRTGGRGEKKSKTKRKKNEPRKPNRDFLLVPARVGALMQHDAAKNTADDDSGRVRSNTGGVSVRERKILHKNQCMA